MPSNSTDVNKIVRDIKESLKKRFLGQPISKDTLHNVKSFMLQNFNSTMGVDALLIDFEVSSREDSMSIIPHNLYTALLLRGLILHPSKFSKDPDGNEIYLDENKVHYRFYKDTNSLAIQMPDPLPYIKVDITFPKEST